jgi:cytochrome c-type biogenesis protein CcmH/NrfF
VKLPTRFHSLLRKALRPALLAFALLAAIAFDPASATAQMMEGMDRTGTVRLKDDHERTLFAMLVCTCGGCQREAINTCPCNIAEDRRVEMRALIATGKSDEQVLAEYAKRYGTDAIAIPPNTGGHRLVFIVPIVAMFLMAGVMITVLRRFKARGDANAKAASARDASEGVADKKSDEYDERLDDELKRLDE